MKLLLTIIFASVCAHLHAQKIIRVDIDKFSGDTTVETKLETVYSKYGFSSGHKVTAAIIKTKSYAFLKLEVIENTSELFMIDKGQSCDIKFTDGSIISIISPRTEMAKSYYSASGTTVDGFAYYTLDEESLKTLKDKSISIIRIKTTAGNWDYEIQGTKSDVVKKQLLLLDKKG